MSPHRVRGLDRITKGWTSPYPLGCMVFLDNPLDKRQFKIIASVLKVPARAVENHADLQSTPAGMYRTAAPMRMNLISRLRFVGAARGDKHKLFAGVAVLERPAKVAKVVPLEERLRPYIEAFNQGEPMALPDRGHQLIVALQRCGELIEACRLRTGGGPYSYQRLSLHRNASHLALTYTLVRQ